MKSLLLSHKRNPEEKLEKILDKKNSEEKVIENKKEEEKPVEEKPKKKIIKRAPMEKTVDDTIKEFDKLIEAQVSLK